MCDISTKHHFRTHLGINHCGFHRFFSFKQHILSKEKKIEMVQKYLDGLKEEIKEVEDYIGEFRKEK